LINAALHSRMGASALRVAGLVALPELSAVRLEHALARLGVQTASAAALAALPGPELRRSVVVVQDAFTSHYDTGLVADFCELLQRLGFLPWLAPFRPNGKPQHVLGFLGAFERTAAANARMLRELAEAGVDLVGVDPSMTLTYRAEYLKALGKDAVPQVALPQEWLAARLPELRRTDANLSSAWAVLPHCTERTNAPAATAEWIGVFRKLGLELRIVASGCCGMAGLYGHERVHRSTSEHVYKLSWERIVEDRRHAGRLMATGYSCRCQVAEMEGVQLPHPLQVLLRTVKDSARESREKSTAPPVERDERHEEA